MPELPEVEHIRRGLEPLAGRRIVGVEVLCERVVRTPRDPKEFGRLLAGERLQEIGRRGKYLLLHGERRTLISHLRMEGRYRVAEPEEPRDPYLRVVFRLDDGRELRYRDVRKFGTMDVADRNGWEHFPCIAALGPEPFDPALTPAVLRQRLNRPAAVKGLLLNQSVIAGLGNIYVDEVLFRARIHPLRTGDSLTRREAEELHFQMRELLKEAIEAGGATVRSYVRSDGRPGLMQERLFVYGRSGEPCRRCGSPVERIVVAGRGTHLCPNCQDRRARAEEG
ncbi:MAG: bifunctional DNA-formamidopyrimidine glycosylase/DNA-(apurinic or apyrimidinic site) lyase [Alicyclobacillaceae bacterium]|nr:bifunctional DNA-formamidopyrimidine glycosylase/DNA-(apurinic or apyrimidinic site) lyase [Alicyclobacillaceae bacterium]